jgi:hypothetical protein
MRCATTLREYESSHWGSCIVSQREDVVPDRRPQALVKGGKSALIVDINALNNILVHDICKQRGALFCDD